MRISDWSSDVCSSDLEADRKRARAILDDERQIAMPGEVMGETITNFWRDAANPRGIWRQSPLDAYLAGKPVWTTLIDVDEIGRAHVCTPVTNAQLVCRLLLEKQNRKKTKTST